MKCEWIIKFYEDEDIQRVCVSSFDRPRCNVEEIT